MEDITVATCSRANCSCKGGGSDLDAGVRLTSGIGNSHGGRPGGMSATGISKSRLRIKEETDRIRDATSGQYRRNRSSGSKRHPDQLRVVGREMWEMEALNSEASDIRINYLDQGWKT